MKQDLMTSGQRRIAAENNRKVAEARQFIGTEVQIGKNEKLHAGEHGEIVGWRFNRDGVLEYAIILFSSDKCILISKEDFEKKGYKFIG